MLEVGLETIWLLGRLPRLPILFKRYFQLVLNSPPSSSPEPRYGTISELAFSARVKRRAKKESFQICLTLIVSTLPVLSIGIHTLYSLPKLQLFDSPV